MSDAKHWLAEMDRLEKADQWGGDEWDAAASNVYTTLTPAQREVLKQLLFRGPVHDGDIASKAARGDLFGLGLAVRCCYKGQQGYTAATYQAYSIYRAHERRQMAQFGL